MSQENPNSNKSPSKNPEKLPQNDRLEIVTHGNSQNNSFFRKPFDAKKDIYVDPMSYQNTSAKQTMKDIERKSCLRKSLDDKQNDRRVKFSSPIACEQKYLICRSAKSFKRALNPPITHPSVVYMGTRLQAERRRQQSHQETM